MKNKKKKTKDNLEGDDFMIKQIAWNTFKNTGNIDTFVELRQIEEIEKNIKAEKNGNNKNEGNSYSRT